jgi:hypothetical protein
MFELVYLSCESIDVMTIIKNLKRFCIDQIVSPVVGKAQCMLVICLIALLFELDMKQFLKLFGFVYPITIKTEYDYFSIRLLNYDSIGLQMI